MRFTVVTILPELIGPALAAGVVGRAHEAGVIQVGTVNPRDFTSDRHRTVDDTPYGGGPGMVMKAPPLLAAIGAAVGGAPARRILLSPSGAPLTQATVRRLAREPHLVLVCGRYEGIDQRAIDLGIDEEISLGDFVLSGGELAALAVIDAVARLVPGVLGEPTSADDESFSAGLLEYPQYTRPVDVDGRGVPEVLASGNHAAIAAWRRQQALTRTAARRPDLWRALPPTAADAKLAPTLDVARRTYVALCHHPVRDRDGRVVTSSLTNFDVHDLARSASTYGLAGYVVVTPITSQRDKAEHIARLWQESETGEHRASALALVRVAASIAEAVAQVAALHGGRAPRVVATSAAPRAFPALPRLTPGALVQAATAAPDEPVLVLFGTGWGLVEEQVPEATCLLTPIRGRPAWNHLSVRSAAAIILDRLFGLADAPPATTDHDGADVA